MGRKGVVIVILLILLIGAGGYIGFDKYTQWKLQREVGIYQIGINEGYNQAVFQIMQQSSTCQPVPLHANNVSMNIVWVECLQQG